VQSFRRAAASAPTCEVNGVAKALSNAGNGGMNDPGGTAHFSVFASTFGVGLGFYNGDIYRCLVYNRALSVGEMALVTNYLRETYGG
jgi:hypothetical protein